MPLPTQPASCGSFDALWSPRGWEPPTVCISPFSICPPPFPILTPTPLPSSHPQPPHQSTPPPTLVIYTWPYGH